VFFFGFGLCLDLLLDGLVYVRLGWFGFGRFGSGRVRLIYVRLGWVKLG
jgi:hypothetical protein